MGLSGWLRRRRREEVPAGVLDRLGLEPGERLLASARLDDGATAAATTSRLLAADAATRHLDVRWHEVDSAGWDPGPGALDVRLVDRRRLRLTMAGDERTLLPEVVRERVQSSVVLSRRIEVRGRRGVRVVVRRTPAGLTTQTLADPGIDLTEPAVAREVERARREVARAAGMSAAD